MRTADALHAAFFRLDNIGDGSAENRSQDNDHNRRFHKLTYRSGRILP